MHQLRQERNVKANSFGRFSISLLTELGSLLGFGAINIFLLAELGSLHGRGDCFRKSSDSALPGRFAEGQRRLNNVSTFAAYEYHPIADRQYSFEVTLKP